MSDVDGAVRDGAARAFARLVRLMPLDADAKESTTTEASVNGVVAVGGASGKESTDEKFSSSSTSFSTSSFSSSSSSSSSAPLSGLFDRLVNSLVVEVDELIFDAKFQPEKMLQESKVEERKFLRQLLQPKTIPDAQVDFEILSKLAWARFLFLYLSFPVYLFYPLTSFSLSSPLPPRTFFPSFVLRFFHYFFSLVQYRLCISLLSFFYSILAP